MDEFELIKLAVKNIKTKKIPLYEHFVDDEVIEHIMGYDFSNFSFKMTTFTDKLISEQEMNNHLKIWQKRINFYREIGYSFLPLELPPLFVQSKKLEENDTAIYSKGKRAWVDEHEGIIKSIDDLDNPK